MKTPYYVGTGLISVVGISFSTIPVTSGAFSQMYANGFCPTADDGTPLPCPDGYGAVLGTAAVCALLLILISFMPPRVILRVFPPIVTGPTVMLIGINLVKSGFKDWAGGSGPCADANPAEIFALCPNIAAPHALPWASAEYLGRLSLSLSSYHTLRRLTPARPGLLRLPDHHPLRALRLAHHEVNQRRHRLADGLHHRGRVRLL
jgi:xanthine/uracil permease